MKNQPKTELFKLQRPLISNGPLKILCYNKNRSIIKQFNDNQRFAKMFKNEYKIYVLGYINDHEIVTNGIHQAEPDW